MHDVVARTRPPGRWAWLVVVAQGLVLASWLPRLGREEGGLAVLMVCLSGLLVVSGVILAVIDVRTALVLTDDALILERRWRPRRVRRDAVRAVGGDVHGRPSWSEAVVITVDGRDRPLRLGPFDVHARVLIPRLQEWAGVGDAMADDRATAPPPR